MNEFFKSSHTAAVIGALETFKKPIIGVLAAIAITTLMDATGLTLFSALPLLPLAGFLWYWEGFSRAEMGINWGRRRDYRLAVLYPVVVLGAATLIAAVSGAVDTSGGELGRAVFDIVLMTVSTAIVVTVTEEGFFRGWLMASLRRAGCTKVKVLLWSSVAFSIWHLSAAAIETDMGFHLPAARIPVYLVNAFLLGAIWGMIRLISGSVVVASVSHAVWNGINYPLFAFGEEIGALGVERTSIFGPEVGVVGLALNGIYAALLWRWWRRRAHAQQPTDDSQ